MAKPSHLAAQSEPITAGAATEQIETGRVRLLEGKEVTYHIRLLPLASFPGLPAAIAAQLNEKKCLVPQTFEARTPENVIHGALERKGSDDWAVLCSVNGATTLYVFFQSQFTTPIALRRQRDTEWLGSEVLGAYGSAWGISLRLPSQISSSRSGTLGLDHDGIEDAYIEKSSATHYFQNGSWITLESPN
ncbi:MAG TPA: hypothetical protein VHT28_03335 [Silvibacterium sp.]|nr:hypothetical protein [Silvibacterium sp.]